MKIKFNSKFNRFLIICILTMLLFVICFYYSTESEKHLEYPSYGAILDHYPVDSIVYIKGSVIEINPESYDVISKYNNNNIIMHISGKSPGNLGDEISLLGILKPSFNIVDVNKIHVLSNKKYNFLLVRSFFALIFLIILFCYYWRFDFNKMVFKRR